ncbi:farnesol dehydrogenase-like [Schistocerca gregaria]|uniref:farnesol dehydrogenase-like n=1 Tax=Schistocerca gregaria TaxID=7010 RepID=UPI00211F2A37|nr:farnesol dehydrogenase-like [Schistocerca gregaria]
MDRWRGRVAVVTGASAGIGAAVVRALLRHGVTVVGVARRPDRVQELAKDVGGGRLHALKGDVSQEGDVVAAFQWVRQHLGAVHILVNNAGIYSEASLTEATEEDMRRVVEVNLLGLSLCTREAVRLMLDQGVHDGHIVHIGSALAQRLPETSEGALSVATKHGVRCLAEGLRKDLAGRGARARVTVISPGLVLTDVFQDFKVLTREAVLSRPHLRPEDVADALLYALSTPPHVQVNELVVEAVAQGSEPQTQL